MTDDEEDDTEEVAETNSAKDEQMFTVTAEPRIEVPVQQPVKKVVKTADSRPVFSPVVIPYRKDGKPLEPVTGRPRVVKNDK